MLIITVSYAKGLLDLAALYWNILGFSLHFHQVMAHLPSD